MTLAFLPAAALALSGQAVAEEPAEAADEAAAQETPPEPAEAADEGAAQEAAVQRGSPEADNSGKMVAMLTERLELNDVQQAKLRQIQEEYASTVRDARARNKAGELDYQKLMAEGQAAGKTRNEKLAAMLDPEQRKAYVKYREETRQRRAKAARLARQQAAQKKQAAQ